MARSTSPLAPAGGPGGRKARAGRAEWLGRVLIVVGVGIFLYQGTVFVIAPPARSASYLDANGELRQPLPRQSQLTLPMLGTLCVGIGLFVVALTPRRQA